MFIGVLSEKFLAVKETYSTIKIFYINYSKQYKL